MTAKHNELNRPKKRWNGKLRVKCRTYGNGDTAFRIEGCPDPQGPWTENFGVSDGRIVAAEPVGEQNYPTRESACEIAQTFFDELVVTDIVVGE